MGWGVHSPWAGAYIVHGLGGARPWSWPPWVWLFVQRLVAGGWWLGALAWSSFGALGRGLVTGGTFCRGLVAGNCRGRGLMTGGPFGKGPMAGDLGPSQPHAPHPARLVQQLNTPVFLTTLRTPAFPSS